MDGENEFSGFRGYRPIKSEGEMHQASIMSIWLCIPILIVAIMAKGIGTWFNFGKTMSWKPGNIVECENIACVMTTISNAKSQGHRVKAYGTGWSWSTTIASDGDVYILLKGSLADALLATFNFTNEKPSVIVGGGVQAFHLYMELQPTGFNIEAKGGCLTAKESQTIGGLLATNVHHSGIKTFYDVVEWIDVVTADGMLQRTFRDETLFRLTIGGGGRTGIIVQAKFELAPRATYENVQTIQPEDNSFRAFFQGFVDMVSGYEPQEFIGIGLKSTLDSSFSGKLRMSEPSVNPVVLPPDYGDLSFLADLYRLADAVLDPLLPSSLYDLYYLGGLATVLIGAAPETKGRSGEDLDVACSSSSTPHLKHQEIEFFVPVDLMNDVGSYLDSRFAESAFPYIRDHGLFALRFVYGSNSLTAANGVLHDGSSPDVVSVNIDSYQRSKWPKYNQELNELLSELSGQFPRLIRTHPGKYNPPLSPDPESQAVKDLIRGFDPDGTFARDAYDQTYLTKPPKE